MTQEAEAQGAAGAAPDRFDVFLSHNSLDKPVVVRIAERLKRAELEPWLDAWYLAGGGQWQDELAVALHASSACAFFIGPHDVRAWAHEELGVARDRAAKDPSFRLIPVLLPGLPEPFDPTRLPAFLSTRTWVDFRKGPDDRRALQDLINAVKGVPFGPDVPLVPRDDVCPYRGLQHFDEEHADFFFGRDHDVQRLLEKLKDTSFLAVLGPSGSGKSSLVRAGLVPALHEGRLPGSESWTIGVMKPDASPLASLAGRLVRLSGERGMQATLDGLGADARSLHLAALLALGEDRSDERLVLVVDQFEEVFSLCRDEAERKQFFANLIHAASVPGSRTLVVVTLRADFYPKCAAYPELSQQVAAHQYLVSPLGSTGLKQAIQEPARRVGLDFEEGLVETIVDDVAAQPGALPLLEHALLELWQLRRGGLLTLEGYRESGGVEGAIAKRADQIYAGFTPEQQAIARRAFLRLTQPGEGTEDTRRRAALSELLTSERENESVETVLGQLTDARMLTTSADDKTGEQSVDVSHEALIRGWPRLRGWIDEDRAGLRVHRRLTEAAREWERLGRDESVLFRRARLAEAKEWSGANEGSLNQLEREFLAACGQAEQDELEQARRRTQMLFAVALVLAALFAVAAGAAWLAKRQTDEANAQKRVASSRAFAFAALDNLDREDLALLLGFEAYRTDQSPVSLHSMITALEAAAAKPLSAMLRNHSSVQTVAFGRDETLASGDADGTIRLWDARTNSLVRQLPQTHEGPIESLAFNPSGTLLASGGYDGTINLWDVAEGRKLGQTLKGHAGSVRTVAFSPSGQTLASGGFDERVRLWRVRTQELLGPPLATNIGALRSVAFSPDDRTLAAGGYDGAIQLWDARAGRPLGKPLRTAGGPVRGLAFSPDGGQTMASAGEDGRIRLWDVAARTQLGQSVADYEGAVRSVAFAPSTETPTLASAGADGTVRLWDVSGPGPPRLHDGFSGTSQSLRSLAYSPDGRLLAAAGDDGTIRLWKPDAGEQLGQPLGRHDAPVRSVAFKPGSDGVLASGSDDGTVRLWALGTRSALGRPLRGGSATVHTVTFSPDRRVLASGGDDGSIRLWAAASGKQLAGPLRGPKAPVFSAAFSPDGTTLAAGGKDGTIRLWETRDGQSARQLGHSFRGHRGSVWSVALGPDGTTLASGGFDGTVRFWDLRAPRKLDRSLPAHTGSVWSVAFSPDGRTLASGGGDATIRFWNTEAKERLGEPVSGHTGPVRAVAFNPDATILASAGEDGTIRLWSRTTRKRLGQPLPSEGGAIYGLAFSPDGRALAAAGKDGTVRLWDGIFWSDVADLQRLVCARVVGDLTRNEWAEFGAGTPYRATCGK